ncbi:DNA-binding transcriptional regulator [Cellulosimicrobium cellulans]|uniref:DNA-binding transcriptional regulator n=1 Tax=Cellulosimicrobium cellulans TaxID=1710 RepID=A0A1Y0HSW9_CELCE|nr:WYL domain-containing protein [Cellulosimicrobium cellulans]ARU50384.1 DNA-binding transcriptional regulator [Cellulosimicrobium cellulans]
MSTDPTGRALTLLSLLQTHRYWPCAELARRLGVTERTVRRDVDRLRGLGYPVAATAGRYGGYRLGSGAHLPPLVVDDDEAVALAVGLGCAAVAAVEGMEETSLRAFAKVESLLPHRLRRRVAALRSSVRPVTSPTDQDLVDPGSLSVLAAACRDHELVRFPYRAGDGTRTRRLVEPHRLVAADRRWYLVAWDRDRGDWRTFRLDRLARPSATGGRFAPREIPRGGAGAFVAHALGAVPRERVATLLLDARLDDLAEVLRWVDHDVVDAASGAVRVRIRGEDVGRLALTVARLALSAPVRVVEPDDLADAVVRLGAHLAHRRRP